MFTLIRLIRIFTLMLKYVSRVRRASGSQETIAQIKKEWAKVTLEKVGLSLKVEGAPISQEPLVFVGNHLSYLDIPVLMTLAPVSFVAKTELASWPIIGDACRSVGTIFVKRESVESRKQVVAKVGEACLKQGQAICLFPSGTTALREEKPWRRGAFEIARANRLKIQPFRLSYSPERIAAFIGDDALIPHLWKLLRTPHLTGTIEFHEPVEVTDVDEACLRFQNWSREIFSPSKNQG